MAWFWAAFMPARSTSAVVLFPGSVPPGAKARRRVVVRNPEWLCSASLPHARALSVLIEIKAALQIFLASFLHAKPASASLENYGRSLFAASSVVERESAT